MTPFTVWLLIFGQWLVNPFNVLRKREEDQRKEE